MSASLQIDVVEIRQTGRYAPEALLKIKVRTDQGWLTNTAPFRLAVGDTLLLEDGGTYDGGAFEPCEPPA